MLSDTHLLQMASEFRVGPQPLVNGRPRWWELYPTEAKRYSIYVRNMGNINDSGPDLWAICFDGYTSCLNKDGQWEIQGLASNREPDFYERCRYASAVEAIEYAQRWSDAITKWIDENTALLKERYPTVKCSPFANYEDVPAELLTFERPVKHIRLDSGAVFDGTPGQFADCFFSNVTETTVRAFARQHNVSVEITYGGHDSPTVENRKEVLP